MASEGIPVQDTVYGEKVTLKLQIPADMLDRAEKLVIEATAARVRLTRKGDFYWA